MVHNKLSFLILLIILILAVLKTSEAIALSWLSILAAPAIIGFFVLFVSAFWEVR